VPPDIVAKETSLSIQLRHPGTTGGGLKQDARAYVELGRASHALQDFWSHSNFVERAIGQAEFDLGGLTTATFGSDDEHHALAHKVRGIADEVAAETGLVDRMAKRRASDPLPSDIGIGDEAEVAADDAFGDLVNVAGDAAMAAGKLVGKIGAKITGTGGRKRSPSAEVPGREPLGLLAIDAVVGGNPDPFRRRVVDGILSFMGSHTGIFVLRRAAGLLDAYERRKQEHEGDPLAHGLLAKDQPGHGDGADEVLRTVKFRLSHALSEESDRRIIAAMKGVFDAPSAAEANRRLIVVFADIDDLIGDAVPTHPLWEIVQDHRGEAQTALNASLAKRR
jgi:hypothetical protein